ncbi:Uncharacterised protein [Actinomyces viscosus]|uniref:Uncharacterized protein n=1 Tax=Actinomyces viscosus TaxID=1656 RepID=A0A3S4VBJ7_ACTVI|nr:Uncharacterised protein [Actinomyces viscosus]
MMRARSTLRPAKAQQRPECFWSVIEASGTRSDTEVSIDVTTARSRETLSTSVVATALLATRAAGSARKAVLRWETQEVSIVMGQRIDRRCARGRSRHGMGFLVSGRVGGCVWD